MFERLAPALWALLARLNWACWLGQHHWQTWFDSRVCMRCQQVGFRRRT